MFYNLVWAHIYAIPQTFSTNTRKNKDRTTSKYFAVLSGHKLKYISSTNTTVCKLLLHNFRFQFRRWKESTKRVTRHPNAPYVIAVMPIFLQWLQEVQNHVTLNIVYLDRPGKMMKWFPFGALSLLFFYFNHFNKEIFFFSTNPKNHSTCVKLMWLRKQTKTAVLFPSVHKRKLVSTNRWIFNTISVHAVDLNPPTLWRLRTFFCCLVWCSSYTKLHFTPYIFLFHSWKNDFMSYEKLPNPSLWATSTSGSRRILTSLSYFNSVHLLRRIFLDIFLSLLL